MSDNVTQLMDAVPPRRGFSVGKVAPRDEIRERNFEVLGAETTIAYYPNKITIESTASAMDDDEDETKVTNQLAIDLCHMVARWDWEGPVYRRDGSEVVPAGHPIPIDPNVVQHIALVILRATSAEILEDAFPNRKSGQRQRKG